MKLAGYPMFWHVYKRAKTVLTDVYIATDHEIIYEACKYYKIPVVMTSPHCRTGTDRAAEAARQIAGDVYVIIQGDEPLIDTNNIKQVIVDCKKYRVVNCYSTLKRHERADNNCVKLMLYNDIVSGFSRSNTPTYNYKQIGLYGIHNNYLEKFSNYETSLNEFKTSVEMYRFIDNKIQIKGTLGIDSHSVDTMQDFRIVQKIIT